MYNRIANSCKVKIKIPCENLAFVQQYTYINLNG